MRITTLITIASAILFASCRTTTNPTPAMLDLKILNGRILDGTGAPWFRGDVGVRGDTIVTIGDLRDTAAKTTIDARGQLVSPGFIDLLGWSQTAVLDDPQLEAKVRQGVTTEIGGEGESPGPSKDGRFRTLGAFLDTIDKQGAAVNFAMLLGGSNPRGMVIGNVNRPPTMDEMKQMEAIAEQAMRDGAIGIGTSLIYVPAMYSTTEELVNLSKVAARYGGVYFTHMRDEGDRIDAALDETFRIGREAGIPVNIWHLKIGPRANWGKMPHVIERIEQARAEGIDASANIYPYAASSTSLSTLAPDWAMEGGYEQLRVRLRNPDDRAKILEAFRRQYDRRGDRGIYVGQIYNAEQAQYQKKFIEQIAAERNTTVDEALAWLFETNEQSPRVIFFSMSEEDVRYALRQPWISIGSDAAAPPPKMRAENTAVHPRAYGSFPRVLGHYARDEKLMPVEEAVRRMTSQAALRANLRDRGVVREGMKAALVVFDPAAVRDLSTFEDPHHFSEGIIDVIVNGVPVLRDGAMTGALPGRSIRGRGYEPAR
ncbi:MAG TPA: D-aminoacylase [Thermoanaerobaculia bacterium]|jgi:N-acyl-D-aspartate/D-glutamate deacylase